jgi:hypothetical protein
MSLEQKYANADAHEQATVDSIHRACAAFMQAHPEYLPSSRNEGIMFAAMTAPGNDHLKPTRAADWEEVFAQVRNQLEEKPRRQQRAARPSGLTKEIIDSWSAKEMERNMYSPERAAEIQAVLSRG